MNEFGGARTGGAGLLEQGAATPADPTTVAASSGEISFTVPGETVPWARAGGGKTMVRFTPPKQRSFMGVLKMFCQREMAGRVPLEGSIELSVMAVYAWPKSWSRQDRVACGGWKTSRPDADNIVKIVKDALNTIAYRDDALVASQHVWKIYGDVPRLVVRLRPLTGALPLFEGG